MQVARFVAALMLFAGSVRALPAEPATDALLKRYLTTDCGTGDSQSVLAALLRQGRALEPELVRILTEGPGAELVAEATAAGSAQWERRAEFLASSPALGLSPADELDMRAVTREDFIAKELARFDFVCRERAAAALAAVGSPSALSALSQARRTVADPELKARIEAELERVRLVPRPRLRSRPSNYN